MAKKRWMLIIEIKGKEYSAGQYFSENDALIAANEYREDYPGSTIWIRPLFDE